MDKLQHVLNTAARFGTGTRKFDCSLNQILQYKLHWLDIPNQVFFMLVVAVHWCLNGQAPLYLSDYCVPVAGADTRLHLLSANRHCLQYRNSGSTLNGCRAFSVAGPAV